MATCKDCPPDLSDDCNIRELGLMEWCKFYRMMSRPELDRILFDIRIWGISGNGERE